MANESFELFDHTADIGIRAVAPTRVGLSRPASEGLYACIGELVAGGETATREFDLNGTDAPTLLRDYLTELLILFEREQKIATSADVLEFTDTRLHVRATTQAVDAERSVFYREVKAITYHALAIREIEGGFEATVIVDI